MRLAELVAQKKSHQLQSDYSLEDSPPPPIPEDIRSITDMEVYLFTVLGFYRIPQDRAVTYYQLPEIALAKVFAPGAVQTAGDSMYELEDFLLSPAFLDTFLTNDRLRRYWRREISALYPGLYKETYQRNTLKRGRLFTVCNEFKKLSLLRAEHTSQRDELAQMLNAAGNTIITVSNAANEKYGNLSLYNGETLRVVNIANNYILRFMRRIADSNVRGLRAEITGYHPSDWVHNPKNLPSMGPRALEITH